MKGKNLFDNFVFCQVESYLLFFIFFKNKKKENFCIPTGHLFFVATCKNRVNLMCLVLVLIAFESVGK